MIPDRWLRLVVSLSDDAEPGLAVELLVERGAWSVVEELEGLITYFPAVEEPERFVADVARDLAAISPMASQVQWSWQPHETWSELWKQGLDSRRIGRRLLVAPSWVHVEEDGTRELLRIDPGVAFGTAEHATTRGCLVHLDNLVRGGESVLDLGSGSGILAIAAVRLGARHAVAVEMDEMACATAAENAVRNGVATYVRFLERTLPAGTPFGLGQFDIVVANMVVEKLKPLLDGMVDALHATGTLVVGGVQAEERDAFLLSASDAGLGWESETVEDGWWSACLRRGPMTGRATSPPP